MKISILTLCGAAILCNCAFSPSALADGSVASRTVSNESSVGVNSFWFDSSNETTISEYYMKTSSSVLLYTESGHFVGKYSVYLSGGRKYINFRNNWICIQGKSRFGYNGNWYVIKKA